MVFRIRIRCAGITEAVADGDAVGGAIDDDGDDDDGDGEDEDGGGLPSTAGKPLVVLPVALTEGERLDAEG